MHQPPSRPVEASHNPSAELDVGSFPSSHAHGVKRMKLSSFYMTILSNLCLLAAPKETTATHHRVSVLFPLSLTPAVLRISSSQYQTVMDDAENIQGN